MTNQQVEEVDLLELTSKILYITKKHTINLLRFIVLKIYWAIFFILLGFSLGFYNYINTKPEYSSEIILRSNSTDSYLIVNTINKLFESKDLNYIKNHLSLSKEQAESIVSIRSSFGFDLNKDKSLDAFYEEYNPKDTLVTRLKDHFLIKIKTTDTAAIPKIKAGLMNMLNSDKVYLQSNELRIKAINDKIDFIDNELNKFNSNLLNNTILNEINKPSNSNIDNEKDVKHTKAFSYIIFLYDQKALLKKELALYPHPISITQDFKASKLEKDKKKSTIVSIAFLFMVMGLILSLVWQNKKKIVYAFIKDNQ